MAEQKPTITLKNSMDLMIKNFGAQEMLLHLVKEMNNSYATASSYIRAGNINGVLVELGRWNESLAKLNYLAGDQDARNEIAEKVEKAIDSL